jgi:hypothetical protein
MTRRSILTILGISPALKSATQPTGPLDWGMPGTGPEQVKTKLFPHWRMPMPDLLDRLNEYGVRPWKHFGMTRQPLPGRSVSVQDWITRNLFQYDNRMGDCGRGHQLPIEIILSLVPYLRDMGFVQFETPEREGPDAKYLQLYGCSGAMCAGVWYGFTRNRNDDYSDILAFESNLKEIAEFKAQTGLSLATAIESA